MVETIFCFILCGGYVGFSRVPKIDFKICFVVSNCDSVRATLFGCENKRPFSFFLSRLPARRTSARRCILTSVGKLITAALAKIIRIPGIL